MTLALDLFGSKLAFPLNLQKAPFLLRRKSNPDKLSVRFPTLMSAEGLQACLSHADNSTYTCPMPLSKQAGAHTRQSSEQVQNTFLNNYYPAVEPLSLESPRVWEISKNNVRVSLGSAAPSPYVLSMIGARAREAAWEPQCHSLHVEECRALVWTATLNVRFTARNIKGEDQPWCTRATLVN